MNAANGIYTMAYRILNICTTPINSIHNAAYPRFFQLGVRGARATEPFARKILRKTTIFGVAGALGMFLTAPLLPHLLGKSSPTLCPPCAGFASFLCFAVFTSARETPWQGPATRTIDWRPPLRRAAEFWFEFNFDTEILLAGRCLGQPGDRWRSRGFDWIVIRWLISREKNRSAPVLEFA